jgi:proteasome component ECM29
MISFFPQEEGVNENILLIWEEIWSDNTPGTEGGVRLYLKEIVSLLSAAAESQSWKTKSQACRGMSVVAAKLGAAIPAKEQLEMLTVAANMLAGRTWEGKEAALEVVADICAHGRDSQGVGEVKGGEMGNAIVGALLKECVKEKKAYRAAALRVTGRVVSNLQLDFFAKLYAASFELIRVEEEKKDGDEGEDEDMEDKDESDEVLALRRAVYECLSDAWPQATAPEQRRVAGQLFEALSLRSKATTKRNLHAMALAAGKLLSEWKQPETDPAVRLAVAGHAGGLLNRCLSQPKASELRKESLATLDRAVDLLSAAEDPAAVTAFKKELGKSLDDVIRDVSSDPATKTSARNVKARLVRLPALPEEEEEAMDQD